MAFGDYGPGTRLVPVMINITVDDDGQIDHCGVGYHIVLPSGTRHEGGFTWHSPQGDYAQAPVEHIEQLQAVMDALLRAAAAHEGAELGPTPVVEPGPERSPQDKALKGK